MYNYNLEEVGSSDEINLIQEETRKSMVSLTYKRKLSFQKIKN
jgi:hypothetical protein